MAQPPLSPEELKRPPLEGQEFVWRLHAQKVERYPEPPPFYKAMYEGRLTKQDLELWAGELYPYWDNLHYAVGGVFVKTNDEDLRTNILKKLVDVEGKEVARHFSGLTTPAYEELWLRFAEGLGVPRVEVLAWKPFTRTHYAIETLKLYSHGYEWTWLDGVASLYAGDLHGHDCLGKAYAALRDIYRVQEDCLEFFQVFLADAETHLAWEEAALARLCCTTERQHTAARAFRERLDIENQLLVAAELMRTGARIPAAVPA